VNADGRTYDELLAAMEKALTEVNGPTDPTDAQWDKPSDTLRRMAGAPMMAGMRECDACLHRHPRGDTCGYPLSQQPVHVCRCAS